MAPPIVHDKVVLYSRKSLLIKHSHCESSFYLTDVQLTTLFSIIKTKIRFCDPQSILDYPQRGYDPTRSTAVDNNNMP